MTRSIRRILLLALAGAAVAALAWYWTRPRPVPIVAQAVQRGTVESTVANTRAGTVKACRRAKLSPALGGQIARLPVHEGERVAAGQVLLAMWNDDLSAQLTLARQEAVAARASAEEACTVADVAERKAQRQEKLKTRQLASEESVDAARGDAKARRAGCQAARAQAQVAAARVQVARANLQRTVLRAPFPGTIAEINGELGEFVTPSPIGVPTPPAVDLIDNSCLYVSAPIDEVDAPAIRPGMAARISLDAFPRRSFAGTVKRIAPYVSDVEQQARTVDVEVSFAHPDSEKGLLPGYSADAEVILATHRNVLRVPTEAVLEGHRVLVYRPGDGLIQAREIKTGLSNWQYTEVVSGLKAGEQVVTSVDREGVKAGAYGRAEPATGAP